MKLGRNDICSCGSGKKYKHCCMGASSKPHAEMFDDLHATLAMNPNLSIDELNVLIQHKMQERNHSPHADFCGLSPTQMSNWFYAPFAELQGVTIATPEDLSSSPVMRYLDLILNEAMGNKGKFKATSKGNLPAKLAKQASALLPEFAVAAFSAHISISEYAGSNEDKFNALHYTRVLAELAGIIYRRSGHYHVKKAAQKQYQAQGIQAFFMPMLEAAIRQYNWGYLDSFEHDVDLRTFWLFMLWRLQSHANVDQLIDEVITAFPDLLLGLTADEYFSPEKNLSILITSRFLERFLEFWGFITIDPKRFYVEQQEPREVQIQPLLSATFQFSVNQ